MHVKTHKLTFLGLLLALAMVLLLLGSYVETSTLFFLAASSFCLGIAVYEAGLRLGFAFLLGAVILSFLLSPNKFYCLTYGGFCAYIYLLEALRVKTPLSEHPIGLWISKLVFCNCCFVAPMLLFFREFLFVGSASKIDWNAWVYAGVLVAAQAFLFLFDWAYRKCVPGYWLQWKRRIGLDK